MKIGRSGSLTVWFPFRFTRRGNGNAVSIRRRFWQSGWASGWKCRCARNFYIGYEIQNPLKELNPDERLQNLQQAFQADAEAIRASGVQNVLLVDDIYTTGSTAEACTRALLSAGIEKVCFFAVCIGQGR